MNWFYNLNTARKLALGFGLCLTLAVIVGMVAVSRMTEMNKVTEDILSDCIGGYDALARFQGAANTVRTIEYRHVLSVTPADKSSAEADISKSEGDAQRALKDFKASLTTPADNRTYQTLQNAWQQYDASKTTVFSLSRKDQITACASLMNGPLGDQFRQVTDQISLLMSRNRMHAEDDRQRAEAAIDSGRAIVIGLLSLSVVLGALSAVFITRYMTGALNLVSARLEQLRSQCITNFADAIQALEHGDLTAEIVSQTEALPIHTRDELGQMARTFNAMLDQVNGTIDSFRKSQTSLRELVINLQSSAAMVASASVTLTSTSQKVGAASEEITATMQEVSLSSEQSAKGASEIAQGGAAQAGALSQGSALVKQLSDAVHGVAQDSEAATQAADDATQAAREGALTVGQSVESMQNIHRTVSDSAKAIATLGEASRQIGGIVQTIDEIAEQTNLLALNAAIEAARAGDAGRGFAVVADEVRKLAERSGAATREISGLIGDVQSRTEQAVAAMQAGTQEVQSGRALAEQAGVALARIQDVVGTVTTRIEGIRAATMQMTSASDEVSSAITEVAAVVEQSSAAAEEMSAAAEQVSASVQTVAGTVAQQSGAVEELVASSESLSGIARSMEAATAQFRVSTLGAQDDEPRLHLLQAA